MHIPNLPVLLILIAAAAASAQGKKLTPAAAVLGALIGYAVYAGDGYRGLILLALFFLLGTAATSWKKKEKLRIKGNAAHQSTRNAGQVFANGGTAAIMGLLSVINPAHKELYSLLLAASLSSATADTLSSELGMVYGRRTFNILTGKRDKKGLDGVVSIEGLLIGIAGSTIIAAAYCLTYANKAASFWIINLAGLLGNLADSFLGATLERKGALTNDTVNFLNTLLAAACAAALTSFHG